MQSEYDQSMQLLAELREQNLKATPPRIAPDEREQLLKQYHPGYAVERFLPLPIGANCGEAVPRELAELLASHSRVRSGEALEVLPTQETDVLVIGGGGAGVIAALEAEAGGARVALVTKLRTGDSNTIMAEGGIQAALGKEDSPMRHFLDSYGGGGFAARRELLQVLVTDAPEAILWLEQLGVCFDRGEDGSLLAMSGGGTSRHRMLSARDTTGAEIMRTLRDELCRRRIRTIEHTSVIELLTDKQGTVTGALLERRGSGDRSVIRAKATVLATGGSGQLSIGGFATSNHRSATGDGLVLAYRAGARLESPGSYQYHPTGIAHPRAMAGALVTEKVRALGARLINRRGEVFVHPLEPRDVTTAALLRECTDRDGGISTPAGKAVWLDTPMIDRLRGPGTVERCLPHTLHSFLHFGIDIRREPVPVYPTLHYQNGGVAITPEGQTTVAGLLAAGEVTGGIHGNNRLMGNALLDVVVFGRRAGRAAAQVASEASLGAVTLDHVERFERQLADAGVRSEATSPLLEPASRDAHAKEYN